MVSTGLGYYFNHGYVNLRVALVLNCVDCFQRLHRSYNLHRKHAHWRQLWENLENNDRFAPHREGRYPQGRQERLLLGRFHDLQRVTPLELLRFWLQQLKTLEPLAVTSANE